MPNGETDNKVLLYFISDPLPKLNENTKKEKKKTKMMAERIRKLLSGFHAALGNGSARLQKGKNAQTRSSGN